MDLPQVAIGPQFCLFVLILYITVNTFSVILGQSSWVEPVLRAADKVYCLRTQHSDSAGNQSLEPATL